MLRNRFFVLIVFVIFVGLFFFGYNVYLVDHSLDEMKFVLEQVSWAQDINDMSRIGVLLDDMLIGEISSINADSSRVAGIEFVKDIAAQGFVKKQVTDAQFLLGRLIKEKEKKRDPLLRIADRLNEKLLRMVRFFMKGRSAEGLRRAAFLPSKDIDTSLLEAAKKYEANWKFGEAISAYKEFLGKYPAYPQLALVELKLGDAHFKSTDYNEAKKSYEEIIRVFPNSDEAKVAEALLKKIKDRIKKHGEKEKLDNNIVRLVNLGPMAEEHGELSLADTQLEKLDTETKESILSILGELKKSGEQVSPGMDLIDKARALEDDWKMKDAQALYEEFILKYPASANIALVKLLLAGAYLKSMQYDKALSAYAGVIKEYPASKETVLAKRFFDRTKEMISVYKKRQSLMEKMSQLKNAQELAEGYYKLGIVNTYLFDLQRAEKAFKNVMELVPGTELAKKAQISLGWTYKFGAQYDDAVSTFSEFLLQNPQDKMTADAKYQLANTYYKWGKFEEAAKRYKEFNMEFANSNLAPIAQFQEGYTLLYSLHKPLEAATAFNALKEKYSGSALADYTNNGIAPVIERSYRYYAFLSLKEGKLEEAEEAFKRAISSDSSDAWSHCGLGTVYVMLEQYDEGINLIKNGVALSSDGYTHAALGFAYQQKGDYQKAIEEYRRSINYDPTYFTVHYNLGRVYILTEQYELAVKELKEAIKLYQDSAPAHNDMGYAYLRGGQIVSAENEFKEALFYDPHLTEASYNLGVISETSGKYQRAVRYFQQVLSDIPDFEPAKAYLEYVETKIKQ